MTATTQMNQPSTTKLPRHVVMVAGKIMILRNFDRFSDAHSERSYDEGTSQECSNQGTSTSCDKAEHSTSPQRYKKGSFVFPTGSTKDHSEANARTQEALRKVPYSAHFDPNGKRTTATIYVGNVDYNASEQDVSETLAPIFQKVCVDNITIPSVQGR